MPRKERNLYQPEFQFPTHGSLFPAPREPHLDRFVREVQQEVTVTSSAVAGQYFLEHVYTPFSAFPQEELWMILLNTRNRITHQAFVYRGTLDAAPVRVAEIYRPAIQFNAASIIISHCHPSGDPSPSTADVSVTEQIVRGGTILSIPCLDHIIVGDGRYQSLREAKLGFNA